MTKSQAIEIIKLNYPSRERYSILCDSLDMVIDILNGDDKYTVKDKQDAIEAIRGNYPTSYSELCTALDMAIEELNRQDIVDKVMKSINDSKPDCNKAEVNCFGECLGYSTKNDDEPIEECKQCYKYISYGEE